MDEPHVAMHVDSHAIAPVVISFAPIAPLLQVV